jgi:DnaA family protein
LGLPDLVSRLGWGPVFQLSALTDIEKRGALQLRAHRRGLEMGDEVADYLLKRCPRDMDSLFNLLNRLDHASLAAQRRLTIPFVRQLLA